MNSLPCFSTVLLCVGLMTLVVPLGRMVAERSPLILWEGREGNAWHVCIIRLGICRQCYSGGVCLPWSACESSHAYCGVHFTEQSCGMDSAVCVCVCLCMCVCVHAYICTCACELM